VSSLFLVIFSPIFLGGFYIFIFLGGFLMQYIHHSVGSRCSWFCFVGCHVNTRIRVCKYLHHPKNESCHMNASDSIICPMTHSYVTRIIYANIYLAPVGTPVVVVPGHFVSIFVRCVLIPYMHKYTCKYIYVTPLGRTCYPCSSLFFV